MKDEIKEILDKLDYIISRTEDDILVNDYGIEIENYITNLQEEKDKFKLRCHKALRLIRDNYGVLDKYGIDMLDDILNGGDDND